MLAKIQNPKWNYLSRIAVLPVAILIVIAFSCRAKEGHIENSSEKNSQNEIVAQASDNSSTEASYSDTIPKQTYKGKVVENIEVFGSRSKVHILFADGTKDSLTLNEAIKQGLKLAPPPPPPARNSLPTKAQWMEASSPNAIYYLNDEPVSKAAVEKLDPNTIRSVNVLKDQAAINKYGQKGRNGVIEINTKKTVEFLADSIIILHGNQLDLNNQSPVCKKVEIEASVNRAEWTKFLSSRLNTFIENAASKGMKPGQYSVQVRFIVELDGSITNIETLTNHGYGLEEGVAAMMKDSPKWNAGENNGKKVRSYHIQPITFVIAEE